jgi:type I restriction-modification system DNA methylase subunit
MNMAIRGIDFNFGGAPGDTLLNDLHPDLRADFVMANPPFNMKEWWNEKLASDPRWIAGTPPQGNANFAWLQHMLYHLAPAGSMALLLANGSMSSNTNNEGEIRKKLIEDDYVECMVALPGQLLHQHADPGLHLVPDPRQAQRLGAQQNQARPARPVPVHRCPPARLYERPRAARLHGR